MKNSFGKAIMGGIPAGTFAHPTPGQVAIYAPVGGIMQDTGERVPVLNVYPVMVRNGASVWMEQVKGQWYLSGADCS